MSAQFFHIDTIARVSPRKATVRQWTVRDIAAEAARSAAACRHVAVPKTPVQLHGVKPEFLPEIVDERVAGATDARGRKLRKDAKVLLAGVVSFPMEIDSVKRSHEAAERYRSWVRTSVSWLQKEYGPALVSVIAHHDEKFPHLHFYAIANFLDGQTMADIHPGMRAIATTEGGKKKKDEAYKAAMRELQERFWDEVGKQFNHTRVSVRPRRRWRYGQWKEIQNLTKDLETRLIRITKAYEAVMRWVSSIPTAAKAFQGLMESQRERQR